MKIWNILRYVLIIAAIGGAIAYMVSEHNRKERNRQYEQIVREQNLQELRKQEEERQKEMDNTDNAEYQYQKWYDKYIQAKGDMRMLSEMANPEAKRHQIEEEFNEAREQVGYWGGLRQGELEELYSEAESQGDYSLMERYENELSNLKDVLNELFDDDNDDIDNVIDDDYESVDDDIEVSDTDY